MVSRAVEPGQAALELFKRAARSRDERVELARKSVAFFSWWYLRGEGDSHMALPACQLGWYREIGAGEGFRARPYRQRKTLIEAPRDHGKTYVAAYAVALHRIAVVSRNPGRRRCGRVGVRRAQPMADLSITSSPHLGTSPSTNIGHGRVTSAIGPAFVVEPSVVAAAATPAPSGIQAPSRGATNQTVSPVMPAVR